MARLPNGGVDPAIKRLEDRANPSSSKTRTRPAVKRVAEADGQTEVATTTIQRQWFFALSSSRWRRGSRFFASLAASRSFRNGQLRLPIELQLGAKRSRRDHCWDTHCNSGKRNSQSFDHVQPPSIASSSTTDRELENVFPITTARLLQAYFAAKILVSWLVAIIGPAFRSLWRESGAAQLPPTVRTCTTSSDGKPARCRTTAIPAR